MGIVGGYRKRFSLEVVFLSKARLEIVELFKHKQIIARPVEKQSMYILVSL